MPTFLNLLTLATVAQGCGVLVHNEVTQRATHLFSLPDSSSSNSSPSAIVSPILTNPIHASSLQAGAFFPDWGYQCFSTDDDAEAAHWPPFLVAAVEHITATYGYLNETSTLPANTRAHLEGLLAFIFGAASHQTADATWHAIRLPTGLLTALAAVDFGDNGNKAHKVLDFGSDFLAARRLGRLPADSSEWLESTWTVPVDDLLGIYERLGRQPSRVVLRYCMTRGLAALRSELAIGSTLLDSFAESSPMLLDEVDGYYLGGIDEMTARTVGCWHSLAKWVTDGISREEKLKKGWGICDVFQAIAARGGAGVVAMGGEGEGKADLHIGNHSNILDEPRLWKRTLREMERIRTTTDRFGVETYSFPAQVPRQTVEPIDEGKKHGVWLHDDGEEADFKPPTYLTPYVPYAHMGTSLSVLRWPFPDSNVGAPSLALAVGAPWESESSAAPGEGSVYLLPWQALDSPSSSSSSSSSKYLPLSTDATFKAQLNGPGIDQRLGTASVPLSVLNTTFLAVSAPGPLSYNPQTPPSLPFSPESPAGRIILFTPDAAGLPTRKMTLNFAGTELGSIGSRWNGETLAAADLDGSGVEILLVGSSRSDELRICNGRAKPQFGSGTVLAFRLTGDVKDVHQEEWSLSIPKAELKPCTSNGHVYSYFGAALAVSPSTRTLWISAPGLAKVFGFKFNGSTFEHVTTIVAPRLEEEDEEEGGLRTGFGHSLATGVTPDGAEWIAVSAPNEMVEGVHQAGVVRVYLTATASNKSPPQLVNEIIPEEPKPYTKFGRTLAVNTAPAARGGSNVPGTTLALVVGSEWAEEERGAVWSANIGRQLPRDGDGGATATETKIMVERQTVKTRFIGEEAGAHFGASLAMLDLAGASCGDGAGAVGLDLVVGIPWSGVGHARQDGRFFGSVAVLRRPGGRTCAEREREGEGVQGGDAKSGGGGGGDEL